MPSTRISHELTVGGVAAAATTGALIAIGRRAGSVDRPFAAIGELLVRHAPTRGMLELVLAGLVVHLAATVVWSVLAVWLVQHVRWRTVPVAMLIGLAQFGLSSIVARASGRGLFSALMLGDRIVVSLVLALAIGVGMRFAFFHRDLHDHASMNRAHPL